MISGEEPLLELDENQHLRHSPQFASKANQDLDEAVNFELNKSKYQNFGTW